jgi:hexosaminidase
VKLVCVSIALTCSLVPPLWGAGDHPPLNPHPQQVRYGPGGLVLRGANIRFASEPSAEERFTAQELAAALRSVADVSIPISEASGAGPAITFERTGSADPLPVPGERPGPDSREAYTLKVTDRGAEIRGRSSAALYYGAQTLRQLVEGSGVDASLPAVEIRDWPMLPYRGIMVDTSHGPLPTESEIKRQLDFMARWKLNQYYFYSEASIELRGYPLLSPEARYSQEQVRRIIAYARERHIDVVPCMELYGHLHDLFRVERYADLAIFAHGSEFDPRNPKVAALLTDWIDQLAKLFPSPFFHIGFDETSEAGVVAGRDKTLPPKLYMQQFQQVSEPVRRHSKTLLVWSDMFATYPELIPQIPKGTVIVPWGYDPTVYEPYWKPFADSPLDRFIATGVSIWDQVAPDFNRSFSNIDTFTAEGRRHGVSGMINTLWTDDIAVLMRPAYPGVAYGAAAAWQNDPVNRGEFFSEYCRIMYPAAAAGEAKAGLDAITRAETELAKAFDTEYDETSPSFWDDPLTQAHLARAAAHRNGFRTVRLFAEDAIEHLSRAVETGGDASVLSQLVLEARLLDYSGMKHLYAAEMADFWRDMGPHPTAEKLGFYFGRISSRDHGRLADLMDQSGDLRQAYRAAWLESYTTYRLGGVMGKWDAEFQYWWKLKRRIEEFREAFHDGGALPPLDTFSPAH